MNPLAWLQENYRVYFGNAASRKDYRAQLRGPRAIFFWGGYLLILILLAGVTYSSIVYSANELPVAQLQGQLRAFYLSQMRLLSILLIFIAPALTATSIVSERMMKSLDLVFTSPMTMKHLLVGKMISSFRYTWMLLILGLPVTAVSVVMGGATWIDVLAAYIILSASALVVTSIGLLISSLTNTPVAAILWTYVAVAIFLIAPTVAAAAIDEMMTMGMGGRVQQQSWVFALSPFYAAQAAPTSTSLGNFDVPNYLIAVVVALLLSKLMLLGAASAMSPFGAKETKSLRFHLLAYTLLGTYLIGRTVSTPSADMMYLVVMGVTATSLCILLPFVVCGSRYADKKYRLEEPINLLATFDGRPSGALPFLWLLGLCLTGGFMAGAASIGTPVGAVGTVMIVWLLAFFTFWWAVGRMTSLFSSELRVNRMSLVMMMLLVIGLPVPFGSLSGNQDLFSSEGIARFYILNPIGNTPTHMANTGIQHAIGLFIVAAVIAVWSELARRTQYRKLKVAHERV